MQRAEPKNLKKHGKPLKNPFDHELYLDKIMELRDEP